MQVQDGCARCRVKKSTYSTHTISYIDIYYTHPLYTMNLGNTPRMVRGVRRGGGEEGKRGGGGGRGEGGKAGALE